MARQRDYEDYGYGGYDVGYDTTEEYTPETPIDFGGYQNPDPGPPQIPSNDFPIPGAPPGTMPVPAAQSAPEPAPQEQEAFNPFGGTQEAITQRQLADFREEAGARGLRVDEGDIEAYNQMLQGFGALPMAEQAQPTYSYNPPAYTPPQTPIDGGGVWMGEPPTPSPYEPTAPPTETPGTPESREKAAWDNPAFLNEARKSLIDLFGGGGYNQDLVNRRTNLASDALERQRKSRMASNASALASRGLLSAPGAQSGAETSSLRRLDESIADQFSNAVSGIYGDEAQRADERMLRALQTAAGMGGDEHRLQLERELGLLASKLGFGRLGLDTELGRGRLGLDTELGRGRLGLDRELGMGNLALGNQRNEIDYNLGLGRLGLDRDALINQIENSDISQLIALINQLSQGAQDSAGGYV